MKFSIFLIGVSASAVSAIPYSEYILAPKSRVVLPVSVHSSNGSVTSPSALLSSSSQDQTSTFTEDSATSYDFGINIAGVVSVNVSSVSSSTQRIGVTFSESSLWVSNASSDATANAGKDETLWFEVNGPGVYTAPREKERGAFRYLTLVHHGLGSMELSGICTIDPKHGDSLIHLGEILSAVSDATNVTWYYNATITNGTSALVDGAKRDKLVWAGDMAIAVPAVVASSNDVVSIENSLNSLFDIQDPATGQLPYAGRPFQPTLSFTYHLYTLIGVADHYLYTGDIEYLTSLWDKWKLALSFSLSYIDSTGLMNVTSPADWLRFGMGGHNIEANSILYNTLNQGIALATALNDSTSISTWESAAARIKTSANDLLWSEEVGMFIDNETTTLTPQDGNSWAVVANLTINSTQSSLISQNLRERWTPYGAPAPEAGDAISPFISGFELQTHFLADNASAALALMRLQWGFMLDDPRMTNSTFVEGYSTTGELHYAPYLNDARISHAHGWATGPTSTLSFYVAGVHLRSAGGKTWKIAPSLGDLKHADAGFSTSLGLFAAKTQVGDRTVSVDFETPAGTMGDFAFPLMGKCEGRLVLKSMDGRCGDEVVKIVNSELESVSFGKLEGGKWSAAFECK